MRLRRSSFRRPPRAYEPARTDLGRATTRGYAGEECRFPPADRTKARAINRCGELAKQTPPRRRESWEQNYPSTGHCLRHERSYT
jgi:hypothetical protein